MAWHVAKRSQIPDLVQFLEKDEWGHVAFVAHLVDKGRTLFPSVLGNTIYLNNKSPNSDAIEEAMLATSQNLFLPVLRSGPGTPEIRDDIKKLLGASSRSIRTIMGRRTDVHLIQNCVPWNCSAAVDYHLMTQIGEFQQPISKPGHLKIKRAGLRDAPALFPLQEAYEKEEVLLDPTKFAGKACLLLLQKNIKKETVFYATLRGKIVAKAGTNATGQHFAQLGGVFTEVASRNRGIGAYLMAGLLQYLQKQGKSASLFVKKDNFSAQGMYKKLGFRIKDEFRIAYYRL